MRSPVMRLALIAGILVHLAGFFAFSVMAPRPESVHFPRPFLVLVEPVAAPPGEPEGIGGMDLLDSAPLFLPTRWNAGLRGRVLLAREEPEPLFMAFAPDIALGNLPGDVFPPRDERLPQSAAELLSADGQRLFTTFGQLDVRPPRTPIDASVSLKIIDMRNGEVVRMESIARSELEEVLPFGPSEYLVIVDASGRVGQPLPVSGQPAELLREWVDMIFRTRQLEQILPPGYYRLILGL